MQQLDTKKQIDLNKLAQFDWYLPLSRGGLVPATLLAYKTNVKKIDCLCIYSYNDVSKTNGEITLIHKDFSHLKGQRVLIIDDIADSGKTLTVVCDYFKDKELQDLKTLTVFYKDQSIFKPDFYFTAVENDLWMNFIWDNKDLDIANSITI